MKKNADVESFLQAANHPMTAEIELLRTIVQSAQPGLTEHIKWNAPSFCADGDDRITFNLHGKGFVRIIFHCGAKAKGTTPAERLIEDKTGLLEWATNDRAVAKFTGMEDIEGKREALAEVVRSWIAASAG